MVRAELAKIRAQVLEQVQAHFFWRGLREGTLPVGALVHFLEQDTGFLLPAYARALARAAAAATEDSDTLLLGHSIAGTLDARDRLLQSTAAVAAQVGIPALDPAPVIHPTTRAHTAFLLAATARSFHSGLGALLPMVWFNAEVSNTLRDESATDSRYRPWIELYHPGDDYHYAVEAFLGMADRAAGNGTPAQRDLLVEQFSISVRYEWAFAESCTERHSEARHETVPR